MSMRTKLGRRAFSIFYFLDISFQAGTFVYIYPSTLTTLTIHRWHMSLDL
jgi:hypothetical protein